ncbi:hypothetical protein BGW39_011525 [Mortierella sp. 14UC]|nr:hypothetical protein BGW39_011525 [Mortierella sp. 14UC]
MKAPKKSTSKSPKPASSPATSSTPSPTSPPSNSKNVFRIHGVNVLNRKNVDSIARLTALERRRATHILDERQRRDTMNQLLTELANLVRESTTDIIALDASSSLPANAAVAAENDIVVDDIATITATSDSIVSPRPEEPPSFFSPPPEQTPTPTTTATTTIPALNADGTERRPPVKSNSITTLRNAIAEIHRLRTYAGLQNIIAAQSSSSSDPASASSVSSPPSVTSSSPPRSSSPPPHSDLCSLSTLAALACQSESQSRQSHEISSPSASPQQQERRGGGGARSKSKRDAASIVEEEEVDEDEEMDKRPQSPDYSISMRMIDSRGANQLYSPPLSPSSPTASQSRHFSSLPMSMLSSSSPMAAFAQPPPPLLHPHYYNSHQQQQYQHQQYYHQQDFQQVGLTPPTLPPLHSMVSSPMESEPTGTGYQYNGDQSHLY